MTTRGERDDLAPSRHQAPLLPVLGERARRRRITQVSSSILVLSVLGALLSWSSVLEDRGRTATTTGTVTGGEDVSTTRGGDVCRDADVVYTVEGREYVDVTPIDGECPAEGESTEILVLYDPDQPTDFLSEENDDFAYAALGLALVGVVACLAGLGRQAYLHRRHPLVDVRDGAVSMYLGSSAADDVGEALAASLPPGVTAYRTRRVETLRPGSPGTWPAAAGIALVLALCTLLRGADPLGATITFLVGLGVAVLATSSRRRVVRVVLVVLLGLWGLVVVGELGDGGAELLTWPCGLAAGYVLGIPVRSRRALKRRQRTAVGAAAPLREPRGGRDVGVLATWHDHAHEYEALDPDPAVVADAVGRLGSPGHDHVSVYRGAGRLDVLAGDTPRHGVTVFRSERRLGRGWEVARTDLAAALREAGGWAAGAAPDALLDWGHLESQGVARPASLRRTD